MPIREMPAFVRTHAEVRRAVIFSVISMLLLVGQLILMKRTPLNVVFDIIIPGTASVTFACYSITMAYDRPVILICPPTIYFVSILVNQLIAVEVGVGDTYPYVILIELIPFIFFSVSVSTDKLKKVTSMILRAAYILLILASLVVFVLSAFFGITVFHSTRQYMKSTFGMICSFFSVFFVYLTMDTLLLISGTDKRVRIPKRKRISELSDR